MKRAALMIAFCLLLSLPLATLADGLVVIVNPASGVRQLSRDDAINIFLGRYRKLPSGIVAFPIDIGSHSAERREFYLNLVKTDLPELDAYWARLIFSGQTSPPLQVPDSRTALQLVASNPNAIAYVYRAVVDERVKVVLELDRQQP